LNLPTARSIGFLASIRYFEITIANSSSRPFAD